MDDRVRGLETRIYELKQELAEARLQAQPEPVEDAAFETLDGPVRLSELFGGHRDLLLVHNMGERCSYCTLWADGLNAYLPGLERRAAVVLVSPDAPAAQAALKAKRGWRVRTVTDADGGFTRAMGYLDGDGDWGPGVSGFRKLEDGSVVRTGTTPFGPGDDFCAVWPLMELVGGTEGWEPE